MGESNTSEDVLIEDILKENVRVANDIIQKLNNLGLKRFNCGYIGADLSDIYIEKYVYQGLINKFLTVSLHDPEAIGSVLIKINISLQHINYHRKSVIKVLEKIIDHLNIDDTKSPAKGITRHEQIISSSTKNDNRIAYDISNNVKTLGLRKSTQHSMGANLTGTYIYLEKYRQLVDIFLSTDIRDISAIRKTFIETAIVLEQIYSYYQSVRKVLGRVIDYCYKEDTPEFL